LYRDTSAVYISHAPSITDAGKQTKHPKLHRVRANPTGLQTTELFPLSSVGAGQTP